MLIDIVIVQRSRGAVKDLFSWRLFFSVREWWCMEFLASFMGLHASVGACGAAAGWGSGGRASFLFERRGAL